MHVKQGEERGSGKREREEEKDLTNLPNISAMEPFFALLPAGFAKATLGFSASLVSFGCSFGLALEKLRVPFPPFPFCAVDVDVFVGAFAGAFVGSVFFGAGVDGLGLVAAAGPAAASLAGGPLLVGPFDSMNENWLLMNFSSHSG